MDILNSPLIFLIIIFASIPLLWYLKRRKLKCKNCGKRTMQEMKAVPEGGILHDGQAQTTSRTAVKMKVKYQCTNCGDSFETLESRQ